MGKNWKRVVVNSLQHGTDLCVQHAQDKHNRSIQQIADQIGENHHTLYKWLAETRMPIKKVIGFEKACGVALITQYLAHANNKMLVDIPTGRKAEHRSLNELAAYTHKVMGMLLEFEADSSEPDALKEAITLLMADFAHQRGQVSKRQQPELLGGAE